MSTMNLYIPDKEKTEFEKKARIVAALKGFASPSELWRNFINKEYKNKGA
jgi:hypothetical protein